MSESGPDIDDIRALRSRLAGEVYRTPVLRCVSIERAIGGATEVFAKLEFLQRTGTFKARGALATILGLTADQLEAGVTAVSAGNHAIATAYAARVVGTHAKVVMISAANPLRIARCREYGAEVVLAADVHVAFDIANRIQAEEGRYFVHPFEGPAVALGTGTLGLEICEQVPDIEALVVPVGGGGLIGGVSNAVKRLQPACRIFGVEPEGADTMYRSLIEGEPRDIDRVRTIADSLGAPYALPYSFGLCQQHVDEIVLVDDMALRRAMGFLFREMKIAVEPACVATTAALFGPLRDRIRGRRIVLVMCGSNIDWQTFEKWAIFDESAA